MVPISVQEKIGEGIYQINDPGVTTGKGGAWGVDMYLVCGDSKALMIDLGNNYIDGYEKDLIPPRKDAKEEFLSVVYGLVNFSSKSPTITQLRTSRS